MTNRLATLLNTVNQPFTLVVNEIFSTPANSLSLKSIRIPTDIATARSINEANANDEVLKFTFDELAASMAQNGYTFSKGRVKSVGMEYFYYLQPATVSDAGLPAEFAKGINPEWRAERNEERRQDWREGKMFQRQLQASL